ncbi:hypothetical protein Aduo_007619 [Ancylostoma duodenale]
MPEDLHKRLKDSHIVRLITAVQILDARPFADVLGYRRDAYIYQILTVAEDAFDGLTGKMKHPFDVLIQTNIGGLGLESVFSMEEVWLQLPRAGRAPAADVWTPSQSDFMDI